MKNLTAEFDQWKVENPMFYVFGPPNEGRVKLGAILVSFKNPCLLSIAVDLIS